MAMIADDDTLVLGTYNGETPTALYLGSWPLSEDVPLNASGEGKWTDVKRILVYRWYELVSQTLRVREHEWERNIESRKMRIAVGFHSNHGKH
ncbi:hypothetical protein RSAG8_03014, partial [Rhizoctonia solani AG-8 WAC10335]